MSNSLSKTFERLARTTSRVINQLGSDAFFVLRKNETLDGRGGAAYVFTPTTTTPFSCFYQTLRLRPEAVEEIRMNQRRPIVYRSFICAATIDVHHEDQLRLVARGAVPQVDLEIIRIAPISGITKEIITAEESPA